MKMESLTKQESPTSAEVMNSFLEKRLALLSAVAERLVKKYVTPEVREFLIKTGSAVANVLPLIGNLKLLKEAFAGKTAAGTELSNKDRAYYLMSVIASVFSAYIALQSGLDAEELIAAAATNVYSIGLLLFTSEYKHVLDTARRVGYEKLADFLDAANEAISEAPPHVRSLLDARIA